MIAELDTKVKQCEEDLTSNVKRISILETEMAVKIDELVVFKGMVNSLEEEVNVKEKKIMRFE